jgi:sugar lactone lactonase YvrE
MQQRDQQQGEGGTRHICNPPAPESRAQRTSNQRGKLIKHGNIITLAVTLFACAIIATPARAQSTYTPYAFTNFAGLPGTAGNTNGTGSAARFLSPTGVAVDTTGNIYVADTFNSTLRKISPTGVTTTLAGSAGLNGSTNGTGSVARFDIPYGVAVDSGGNVYVADRNNHTIRKITPASAVTTLAGTAGLSGSANGTGSTARFQFPYGVAVDNRTNVYVADTYNHTIRKITPAGAVTTLAGSAGHSGSTDGSGSTARFNYPIALAVDSATNVYVADYTNHTIRKITPAGAVTTLAGSAGHAGSADGTGSAARFSNPNGVAVDNAGNLYVADSENSTIRRITPANVVTTLAGTALQSGSADGTGSAAEFKVPRGVAVDAAGKLYVADTDNYRVTKGTPLALQFEINADSQTVSNGYFQMRLVSSSLSDVVVETSTNLQSWTPVQTNALPPDGLNLSVPMGTNPSQFFRAHQSP